MSPMNNETLPTLKDFTDWSDTMANEGNSLQKLGDPPPLSSFSQKYLCSEVITYGEKANDKLAAFKKTISELPSSCYIKIKWVRNFQNFSGYFAAKITEVLPLNPWPEVPSTHLSVKSFFEEAKEYFSSRDTLQQLQKIHDAEDALSAMTRLRYAGGTHRFSEALVAFTRDLATCCAQSSEPSKVAEGQELTKLLLDTHQQLTRFLNKIS